MPFGELLKSWSRFAGEGDGDEGIFRTMKADGVLGLGFSNLNTLNRDQGKTFIDELYEQNQISKKVFGIFYGDNEESDEGKKSDSLQSYVNIGHNIGDVSDDANVNLPEMLDYQTCTILDGGYWLTKGLHVGVDSSDTDTLNMCGDTDCTVLVDSGSSFIAVPSIYYKVHHNATHMHIIKEKHIATLCNTS